MAQWPASTVQRVVRAGEPARPVPVDGQEIGAPHSSCSS